MNNLFRELSFPVSFLNKPFDKEKYSNRRQTIFEKEDISIDYLNIIKKLGIELSHVEVFFSLPNTPYTIHKDTFEINDFPKINFLINGEDSTMCWYFVKPNNKGFKFLTSVNTESICYAKNDVNLLFKTKLPSISLVQAGIPHNVQTTSKRWCISTVYTINDKVLTWDESLIIFKDFLVKDI